MNNDIYKKNIECINQYSPGLMQQIERLEKDDNRPDKLVDIEVMQGKRGFQTFSIVTKEGKKIAGHSIFDPVREAAKKFSDFSFDERQRVVLLGFGFGYEARHAINNTEHSIVVVFEPFISVFKKALESVDITDIISSGRILISFTLSPGDMKYVLTANSSHVMAPDFKPASLPHVAAFPEFRDIVVKAVKETQRFLEFGINTGRYAGAMLQNNLALNFASARKHPGINRLRDKFKGKPVFVVAPGPSLENNIEQLKRVKGKALIVCCDTSTRPMLRHGIEPDIIMTIDYQPANYYKLRGVDTSFAYLAPALEVYPYVVTNHRGRMFGYYHRMESEMVFGPILGALGTLSTGGSVLTDCFNLARYTGADPIVLMGVDLGFPGMKWYADGSFDEGNSTKMLRDGRADMIEVEDIYGNPMPTYASFYEFISWFNIMIPAVEDTVIDATEGGAKLEGSVIMKLSDVIDKYVEDNTLPVKEVLDEAYSSFNPIPVEKVLAGIDSMIASFESIVDVMEKGLKNCRKAIDILSKSTSLTGNSELIRLLKRINEAKEVIGEKEKESHLNFLSPMMEQQMSLIYNAKNDESLPKNEQYREMVKLDRDFYEKILKASRNMMTHFKIIKQEIMIEGDEEFV